MRQQEEVWSADSPQLLVLLLLLLVVLVGFDPVTVMLVGFGYDVQIKPIIKLAAPERAFQPASVEVSLERRAEPLLFVNRASSRLDGQCSAGLCPCPLAFQALE